MSFSSDAFMVGHGKAIQLFLFQAKQSSLLLLMNSVNWKRLLLSPGSSETLPDLFTCAHTPGLDR